MRDSAGQITSLRFLLSFVSACTLLLSSGGLSAQQVEPENPPPPPHLVPRAEGVSLVYDGFVFFPPASFGLRLILRNESDERIVWYKAGAGGSMLVRLVYQNLPEEKLPGSEEPTSLCGNYRTESVKLNPGESAEGLFFLDDHRDDRFRIGVDAFGVGGPSNMVWTEPLVLSDVLRNPSSKFLEGRPELLMAAARADVQRIRKILDDGGDVNLADADACTALHIAALLGNLDACESLIDLGARVDARAGSGHTPLTVAIRQNRVEVARLLIRHGANVNLKYGDPAKLTPLREARMAKRIFQDGTIMKVLLEAGAQK